MSKAEEKRQAIVLLKDYLRQRSLLSLQAAKNVLTELERTAIPSALVTDIRLLLTTARDQQKEIMLAAVEKL